MVGWPRLRFKTSKPIKPPVQESRVHPDLQAPKPRKIRDGSRIFDGSKDETQVAWRVVTSCYTFRLGGRKYRIIGDEARPSLFYQEIRLETGANGHLRASYQGRPVLFVDCGRPAPSNPGKSRKAPNAGGRSLWMRDFFERAGPPVWVTNQKVQRRDKANAPEGVR
jgi:hypothetical protein